MSYCSRSNRRRFTVFDFKTWAYSLIYGHIQQHLYCACTETVILNSGVNLDTAVRFAYPDFLSRVQNIGDLATFSVDFCILYADMGVDACPPYFYFRFVWPTDLESIPHASIPMSIIPTKFEASTPIRSLFMSDNVSHWLKMRTRPLRIRRITWPVSRGSKTITFLESPTPICLFTIQLWWL